MHCRDALSGRWWAKRTVCGPRLPHGGWTAALIPPRRHTAWPSLLLFPFLTALGREQCTPCHTRNISYYLAAHFVLQSPGFGDRIVYIQHFATSRAASASPQLEQQLWHLPVCLLFCGKDFGYVWTCGTAQGPLPARWAGKASCSAGWFCTPGLHSCN